MLEAVEKFGAGMGRAPREARWWGVHLAVDQSVYPVPEDDENCRRQPCGSIATPGEHRFAVEHSPIASPYKPPTRPPSP